MAVYFVLFMIAIGAIGLSAIVPFQVVPRILRRAASWGILDFPDERKIHATPTPRLGGMSIMPAVWLGCSLALLLGSVFGIGILSANLPAFNRAIVGLLIGASGIFILGMIDDFKRLSAIHKLTVQIGIAALTVHFIPAPSSILGFEMSPWMIQTLMFSWLVVVPNAVNLLDGVDGLTSSISSVFLVLTSLMAVLIGEIGWLFVLLPTLAAVLGFLKFNWRPASIFLGDSGSLLLGFCVAYLSIHFALTPASGSNWNLLISLCLCFVWLLDTALAILRRYWTKRPSLEILVRRSKSTYLNLQKNALANIVRPDRKHIHHQLQDLGLSSSRISIMLAGIAGAIGLIGLSIWSKSHLSHFSWADALSFAEIAIGFSGLLIVLLLTTAPHKRAVSPERATKRRQAA